MPSPKGALARSSVIAPIRLITDDDRQIVYPVNQKTKFAPFVLPGVPHSLLRWASIGTQRVWEQHRRCAAVLLLINSATARWTLRIPAQRCGRDAATWSNQAKSFAGLSTDLRLAGSFQTRLFKKKDEPADFIPSLDGIHLIRALNVDLRPTFTYLRANGRVQWIDPLRVTSNDWIDAINRAMPRLTLA